MLIGGMFVAVKSLRQWMLDHSLKTWRVESFPLELDEEEPVAWIHAVTGTLRPRLLDLGISPTIVFETWGDKQGKTFRIRVPWQHEEYIMQASYAAMFRVCA